MALATELRRTQAGRLPVMRNAVPSTSLLACTLASLLGSTGCATSQGTVAIVEGGVPLYDGGYPAWIVTCRPTPQRIQEATVARTGSSMHFGPEVRRQLSSLPPDRKLTFVFGMIDVHRAVALVLSEVRDGNEVIFRGPRAEPLKE